MLNLILKILSKSKLKRFNCKITSDITKLPHHSQVICESFVNIGGNVLICGHLSIGAHSYIRSKSEAYGQVTIGRYCSIANGVIIGLDKNQHPLNWLTSALFNADLERKYQSSLPLLETKIGHDCWIGRDAIIMSGVEIGTGAIIGARAVVTQNVPAYAIVVGTPAKVLKYRFVSHIIEKLLNSSWWNLATDVLLTLDLSNPQSCLDDANFTNQAQYQKLKVSKKGVSKL